MALQLFFEFCAHLSEFIFESSEGSGGSNYRVLILFSLHFHDYLGLEWMWHFVRRETDCRISQQLPAMISVDNLHVNNLHS